MKTIFKKGDKVFDIRFGYGEVTNDSDNYRYPVSVMFKEVKKSYTFDGRYLIGEHKLLSLTEYTLEGFSQERPCEFKDGDAVWVRTGSHNEWRPRIFKEYRNGEFYTYDTFGQFSCWEECKPFKSEES